MSRGTALGKQVTAGAPSRVPFLLCSLTLPCLLAPSLWNTDVLESALLSNSFLVCLPHYINKWFSSAPPV